MRARGVEVGLGATSAWMAHPDAWRSPCATCGPRDVPVCPGIPPVFLI